MFDFICCWLETEADTRRLLLEHPEIDTATDSQPPASVSPFHWTGTIIQLYELICALWYCGKIADSQGAHFSFSSFVRIFEVILNVRLTGIFHKREQLIRKKSSTPFLDKLKSVLIENLKKLPSEQ